MEKHFARREDWERECGMYFDLDGKLPLPRLIERGPNLLVTEYLALPHFLSVLESQERAGFDPVPWRALGRWLQACGRICGKLPRDGNLRNFLWDSRRGQVTGLDLESCAEQPLEAGAAALLAHIQGYAPAGTPVKRQAVKLLSEQLGVSKEAADEAYNKLLHRREGRRRAPMTGVVLAGGLSSRMGRSKAALPLLGKSMLEWQVGKLRQLGAEEVLISGPAGLELPGTRTVPDLYQGRGPLGGLHACLSAARHPICLVLTVDMPLVPPQILFQLCHSHEGEITMLVHDGKWEPLLAVYDTGLARRIAPLIRDGGAPVKRLLQVSRVKLLEYLGPDEYMYNCNTPDEYRATQSCADLYAAHGIPLG